MFEKYYLILVLGLCVTTCYQTVMPKETYSFAAPIQEQYICDSEEYFDNSGDKENKKPKAAEELMVAYGNISQDKDAHFREFRPTF